MASMQSETEPSSTDLAVPVAGTVPKPGFPVQIRMDFGSVWACSRQTQRGTRTHLNRTSRVQNQVSRTNRTRYYPTARYPSGFDQPAAAPGFCLFPRAPTPGANPSSQVTTFLPPTNPLLSTANAPSAARTHGASFEPDRSEIPHNVVMNTKVVTFSERS